MRRNHLVFSPIAVFGVGYTISILMKTRSDAKHAQGARVSEKDEEGNTPLHLVMWLVVLLTFTFTSIFTSIFVNFRKSFISFRQLLIMSYTVIEHLHK